MSGTKASEAPKLSSSLPPFQQRLGSHWPGIEGLDNLIIFGDSYSAIGDDPRSLRPTPENPLGAPSPVMTWAEIDENGDALPNWVVYLSDKLNQSKKSSDDPPVYVYDYAVGGHTIAGLRTQIQSWFLPKAGNKPEWAKWDGMNSLFITWIGINDCAMSMDHSNSVKAVFALQLELYEAGARNFLFIDVPPVHQTPAVTSYRRDTTIASNTDWNTNLHKEAVAFRDAHPDASVFLFSSWAVFDEIYKDPGKFGFPETARKKMGGEMWWDHLHPTSAMHRVIAEKLEEFLRGFPAMACKSD